MCLAKLFLFLKKLFKFTFLYFKNKFWAVSLVSHPDKDVKVGVN